MLNKELVQIWEAMGMLTMEKVGAKFTYGIAKNKKLILPIVKEFDKMRIPSPEFMEYDQERMTLCGEYSEKNDDGEAKINGEGNFALIEEKREEFEKALVDLKGKHDEAFKIENGRAEEYTEIMETEVDIELWNIQLDDCPSMTEDIMSVLMDVIIKP